MKTTKIDRSNLAKFLGKTVILQGIRNKQSLRGGEFRLITGVKVALVNFTKIGLTTEIAHIDHLHVPNKGLNVVTRVNGKSKVQGSFKVVIYTRNDGSQSYGLQVLETEIDNVTSQYKYLGLAVANLVSMITDRKISQKNGLMRLAELRGGYQYLTNNQQDNAFKLALLAVDKEWLYQAKAFIKYELRDCEKRLKKTPAKKFKFKRKALGFASTLAS